MPSMTRCPSLLRNLIPFARTLLMFLMDAWRFLRLCLRPSPALAAENLFLCKQLALYQERQIKPRHTKQATRMTLAWLARWFDWRHALVLGQPATLIRQTASQHPGSSSVLILLANSFTGTGGMSYIGISCKDFNCFANANQECHNVVTTSTHRTHSRGDRSGDQGGFSRRQPVYAHPR
jgi:hypothetical protein